MKIFVWSKQSQRQWYKRFDSYMLGNGFCISSDDNCVYYKQFQESKIYLLLYVDDMFIIGKKIKNLNTVKIILTS